MQEMTTMQALRILAEKAGNACKLSLAMGQKSPYVSVYLKNEHGNMSCSTMAAAADIVGLKLCICSKPPKDAIVITPNDKEQ